MVEILVVEDDVIVSGQVKMLLEAQGYGVELCADGREADEALIKRDYSMLILDWDLPLIKGTQVCENYRTRGGLAPVLMLTGRAGDAAKEMAFEAGADDYLTKPFSMRELAARVKAMLRRTEQLTERLQAQPSPKIVDRHLPGGGDPFIDTIFADKYKIFELLGEGGNGSVYGALHIALNRPVAVKFLHSFLITRTEARIRFEREAKVLSDVEHQNIVRVFDYGIEQGQPYMVLERLEGMPLSFIIEDKGALSIGEALPLFAQICDGMECAHKQGILHRDLKPQNIILVPNREGASTAKILDLGLAKDTRDRTKLTETGLSLGTAEYMSPEQCKGKQVGPASDIYSMGCLMYEVLTGKPPFTGADYSEVFHRHLYEAPEPFASKLKDRMKAGRIEQVVLKALSKSADERQPSFVQLKRDLAPHAWF